MSYGDLLERIKQNDPGAFLEMTDRYGWSVYSIIRKKYTDSAMAEKVYNETMNIFYRSLANSSAEDPMEAILCAFADQIVMGKPETNGTIVTQDYIPPEIQLENLQQPAVNTTVKVRKKSSFWYKLGVFLVSAAIAVVLWCIVGLLMYMNYIPYLDLGYSWFNANIVRFF